MPSDRHPVPNPGSDEAIERGCTCPVIDNNRGRYAPFPPDEWYYVVGCEIHDPDGLLGLPVDEYDALVAEGHVTFDD